MISEGSSKIAFFAIGIALLFVILGARLWQLQILHGKEYAEVSLENRLRIEHVPSPRGIIFDRNGIPLVKNSAYFFVSLRPEAVPDADIEKIARFLSMNPVEIHQLIKNNTEPFEPVRLKGGLSFKEVAYIEARLSDYPGLIFDVEETRNYLYGETGAHLIGYLGKLNPQQARHKAFKNVPRNAFIGQWGIEKMYDDHLRGVPGRRAIEADALGRRLKLLSESEPEQGEDIYLSIDIELQQAAEEAFGDNAGALVAIKPYTGEVLALVSRPSFDPNLFSRGINYADWVRLANDKRYPMLNRALQSQYPPGSTFKIVTSIAALETESITTRRIETCNGALYKGRWRFGCWKRSGHGLVDFHKAIVESCDVYFYKAGEYTGINWISYYAHQLGLGAQSGIGLVTEKSGLIPDTEWKKRTRDEPWYVGETYHSSIGQGFVLTTPMQLARMISTVASDGYRYKPMLVKAGQQPQPEHIVPLKEKTIQEVKRALRGVVTESHGTGWTARSSIANIAGKTGTAQVISQRTLKYSEEDMPHRFRDHAWFVAYAPASTPEIAVAVFVEHGGHGGSAAAPIARKAIEAYIKSLEKHNAQAG